MSCCVLSCTALCTESVPLCRALSCPVVLCRVVSCFISTSPRIGQSITQLNRLILRGSISVSTSRGHIRQEWWNQSLPIVSRTRFNMNILLCYTSSLKKKTEYIGYMSRVVGTVHKYGPSVRFPPAVSKHASSQISHQYLLTSEIFNYSVLTKLKLGKWLMCGHSLQFAASGDEVHESLGKLPQWSGIRDNKENTLHTGKHFSG